MQGRAIVITGGFGVLGQAAADLAARKGARLTLIDYAQIPDGLADRLGPGVLLIGGVDLADPASAEAALGRASTEMGGIDTLLNIAGGFVWQTLADGDPVNWDRMFRLNLKTCATASRAALPHLLASRAGAIVNVGPTPP